MSDERHFSNRKERFLERLENDLKDSQQTNQHLVELLEKCAKYFDMEDSSLFRPNNPFGKEIRAIVYELRAEIKKVKGRQ